MSEVQNTEQGTNTPVQNTKKFLDYAGLQKFWELVKNRIGSSISSITDDGGVNIKLNDFTGNELSSVNIPIATEDNIGLMSSEHAKVLSNISNSLDNQVTLKGVGFGSVEDGTFKTAVIDDIVVKTVNENGDENIDTLEKYLNIDLVVDKDLQELCIIDRNSYQMVDSVDPETGDTIKIKEKTNNVLSKVAIADICAAGLITSADIIEITEAIDNTVPDEQKEYVTKIVLRLTLEYKDGEEGIIDINVEDLIHQYSAGDGLDLTNVSGSDIDKQRYSGTFKIKIKNIAESGNPENPETYIPAFTEKYLKVDSEGLYTDGIDQAITDAVSVCATKEEVDTKVSSKLDKLQSSINIVGGPLETTLKDIYTEGYIPQDETFHGFLEKLALKIENGKITYASPSSSSNPIAWSKGISHSNITFNHNNNTYSNGSKHDQTASAKIECGEYITASVTIGTASNSEKQCKLNASDGYFKMNPVQFNENGTPNLTNATWEDYNSATSLTLTGTGKSTTGEVKYTSILWSGSNNTGQSYTEEFIKTIDNTPTNTLNSNGNTSLRLKAGENSLTVKTDGVTFNSGKIDNAVICAATNTHVIVQNPSTASNTLVYIYNDSNQTFNGTQETKYKITGYRADWFVCSPEKVIKLGKGDLNNDTDSDGYPEYSWSDSNKEVNNIFRATTGVFNTGKNIGHTVPTSKTENMTIPKDTLQVVIAVRSKLTGIKSSAQNAGIIDASNMLKFTMDIEGANGYTKTKYYVYIYNYGAPLGASDTYILTYE